MKVRIRNCACAECASLDTDPYTDRIAGVQMTGAALEQAKINRLVAAEAQRVIKDTGGPLYWRDG